MKYLICRNEKAAKAKSAKAYECKVGGMTKYRFSWANHPKLAKAALIVTDDQAKYLSKTDQQKLIDELDESWSPKLP